MQVKSKMSMTGYAWLLSAPAVMGLIMFMVIPFILAIYFSFTSQTLLSNQKSEMVGFDNYSRLLSVKVISQKAIIDPTTHAKKFKRVRRIIRKKYRGYRKLNDITIGDTRYTIIASDPQFLKSIYNIVRFVLMVVPLQMGLALGMALLVNQRIRGRTAYRTLFFAPVVTSMVVVSIVWMFLYNRDNGLINQWIETISFGLFDKHDWLGDPNSAMPAIVVMSAWQGAGFHMVIFLAGLQNISQDLYEAAELDGAKVWNKFKYITIPGLKNTITFITISIVAAAFSLYVQIDVMTKGGPSESTSTVMYHAVNQGFKEGNIAYASAISVLYFIIILAISLAQYHWFERKK